MLNMFASTFLAAFGNFANVFASAQPFRHVIIDGFLERDQCAGLLEDFPAFEKRYALNELGDVGGKAVRMDMPKISPRYAELDCFLQSDAFLRQMEALTGIPELLYDPEYIGGGTHENVQGQGLDPHVDFNILPKNGWHRRLNIILYLNQEWEDGWGGCLELELDPWSGDSLNKITVLPLFNRCVVFETNEISWHGFTAIQLPEEKSKLTRKSIAIYLYTKTRAAEDTVAAHGTVYVPRGLPKIIQPGSTLDDQSYAILSQRFAQLRGQLKYLYKRELEYSAQLRNAEIALAEASAGAGVPLEGYARLQNATLGYWPDGWCAQVLHFEFQLTRAAKQLTLEIWVPNAIAEQCLHISMNSQSLGSVAASGGLVTRSLIDLKSKKDEIVVIELTANHAWQPAKSGQGDERQLAFKLIRAVLD